VNIVFEKILIVFVFFIVQGEWVRRNAESSLYRSEVTSAPFQSQGPYTLYRTHGLAQTIR